MRTVPCPLQAAARRHPGAVAVAGPDLTVPDVTYAALEARVAAAAARLRACGVGGGMRAAFYLPNDVPLVVLLLAAIRAGAVAAPLSTRQPPGGVAAQLRRLGARLLVTDDAAVAAAAEGVPVVRAGNLVGEETAWEEKGARDGALDVVMDLDAPATALFTSGSSGTPKAALHTFGNHYHSALGSNENVVLGPGDRWLLSLPLYHVGGLGIVFRCLLAGAAVVLPERRAPLDETVERMAVTHASLVSTQLLRLLERPAALRGLRAVLLGGSAIPPSLLDAAVRRGLPVHTSYGLTEMASQVTTTPPGAGAAGLATSGRLLPYRRLRVAPDGEIWVNGETRFAGYLDGDALHRPFDAGGWYATGDLGRLDADGYLHVAGRKDNLFVSGGENIQPEEIEAALCRLDGVAQAVVVPVPDDVYGQRPVAFVRTTPGGPAPEGLAAGLGRSLPRFKIPDAFYRWPEEVPEGMKVDRRAFVARARREQT